MTCATAPLHVSARTRYAGLQLLLALAFATSLLAAPTQVLAKKPPADKTAATPPKKKGVSKVTHQRSPSEETRSERDRRMYRECKGMHNAGACRGYTR